MPKNTRLSSCVHCYILFDIVSRQLAELKMLILNRWRRLFHSSRVKFLLVRMSTYLIWISGSRLILSNNPSSATLWVLDTCFIVGLLPLMIILVHFVMDRAILFTDHKISGLPMRAKKRHFRTICEQTVDNSPTDAISSSLNCWSYMRVVTTLYNCCIAFIRHFAISFHTFLCMSFHVTGSP